MNKVRQAIAEGRLAIGTHCTSEDIGLYEICGKCGYDYIWIDAEHGPMTLNTILDGIVGTASGGCDSFVRVAKNDPVLAKPVLEMGADGIIFPMINTPEEAETAVKSCMYPPMGTRGYGPIRALDYCGNADEYIKSADNGIFKIIQAEHIDCVNNLDEILDVPNIVDTLYPAVCVAEKAQSGGESFFDLLEAVKDAASAGAQSTKEMTAKYGRASRLGERSRGVLDAGAVSCSIIICAMADAMQKLLGKQGGC